MDARYGMKLWGSPTTIVAGLFLSALSTNVQAETVETSVSLRNRTITEGVLYDNKDGFMLVEADAEWEGFTVGLEYLQSLRENYNEVHISLGYGVEIGPLAIGFGGARVDYSPGSDEDTWELFGELEWAANEWLEVFVDGMVDVDDVQGGFVETGASLTPPEFGPGNRFAVEPYLLVGWDIGYVSGPRQISENHWQSGVEVVGVVTDNLAIFADVNHSRALTNLDREGEGNHTWAGVGMRVAY